jgi:uncharacterized membrane protein YtjA (UPF0391 family)
MLGWILALGLCALVAGYLGFVALGGAFAFIAKLILLATLALLVIGVISTTMDNENGRGVEQ